MRVAQYVAYMALPSDPEAAIQELRRRYPAWTIWRSDLGRLWANRKETLPRAEFEITVRADTAQDLEALLFEQEQRRERIAVQATGRRGGHTDIPFQTGEPT